MPKTKTAKMAAGKKTELSQWMLETAQGMGYAGINWVDGDGKKKIKT